MNPTRIISMRIATTSLAVVLALLSNGIVRTAEGQESPATSPAETTATESSPAKEADLISSARQITFEGRRAGEGYFNRNGSKMVFQSERDPANPFYQIYVMDLETGDIEKISPGQGRTTCAWIHPEGDRILFSSTHHDPTSVKQQQDLIERRKTGDVPRYSWNYDPEYEIYERTKQGDYRRLTDAHGYDAEASYSPDGRQIVFASNRAAYGRQLSERESELLQKDKQYFIDLYIMDADGSNVRQLTDVAGYDGGPFFSPDGKRICWRRFSEDGLTAEIYTMGIDGTDVRRLTEINAMSWAPFFHPSGDYLVFTTNRHGFDNFELYCVRADGKGDPVRVTYTDGFDGLPVFLPNGTQISWTTNRTPQKQSQIFLGDWNDAEIRRRLGLDESSAIALSTPPATDAEAIPSAAAAAEAAAKESLPDFSPQDIARHVDYLTRPELEGRLTGTHGEKLATAYVAAYLEGLGFVPAGQSGTFFDEFEFPAGCEITPKNELTIGDKVATLDKDWRPLSFSANTTLEPTEIVFAGYGLRVPGTEDVQEYDSYVHLNVAGRWVMVFRDMPQDITPERRQQFARYSSPRRKASFARDMGAKGIIFVAGPTSKVRNELIRFDSAASASGVSIAAISITNEMAEKLFSEADGNLGEQQASLDNGELALGYLLEGDRVGGTIDIDRKTGVGRNVIARLPADRESTSPTYPLVAVGAHVDHLGRGAGSNSLAREDELDQVHQGADDNASGVAAMLEIAQYLATEQQAGRLKLRRDLLIAAWSGEELGLYGSQSFVDTFDEFFADAPKVEVDPEAMRIAQAHGMTNTAKPLTKAIAVYLNLDMVGRLREKLVVQGLGSSPKFESLVNRRNVPVGLPLTLDKTSTRLPTDASAFVSRDVPILSAFTGAHEDYHTPRDTKEKLNYDGAADTAKLFALLSRGFLSDTEVPEFKLEEGPGDEEQVPRARLTASLGTVPDYGSGKIKGQKLSGIRPGTPADDAGLKGGDVVVELAGQKIEDIYDYTYAIEALKIGEETTIKVLRGDKTFEIKITPAARE
ncbi:M28 family peptidase [Roseiconus lacunae]|uniref:M28 family peptidase n=1 Tax=Roseiconus lacunae TaxID=2605694 RepID=A0ABT7PNE9_9BACT|nr:M28 family peptidase [Roseiconus lacunae]MDM4018024.1 M28 family peptidase [Roseiconus lacunae]